MRRRQPSTIEPVLITDAAPSRFEEYDQRRRRYAIVMATRVACFILAIIVPITWLRIVFIVGSVVLPWVAVVAANQVKYRAPGHAAHYVPEPHRALPGPPERRP